MNALSIVRKHFPNVKKVRDAKKSIVIEVTPQDIAIAKVKEHEDCAMAVACRRLMNIDGAVMAVNTIYTVKGNIATRHKVPESVSREIISFDRDAGFAEGVYMLNPPSPSDKLGYQKTGGKDHLARHKTTYRHMTTGIRATLGRESITK